MPLSERKQWVRVAVWINNYWRPPPTHTHIYTMLFSLVFKVICASLSFKCEVSKTANCTSQILHIHHSEGFLTLMYCEVNCIIYLKLSLKFDRLGPETRKDLSTLYTPRFLHDIFDTSVIFHIILEVGEQICLKQCGSLKGFSSYSNHLAWKPPLSGFKVHSANLIFWLSLFFIQMHCLCFWTIKMETTEAFSGNSFHLSFVNRISPVYFIIAAKHWLLYHTSHQEDMPITLC